MVQPVELQDVLSKTQAAERITQLQKASPENDQRQSLLVAGQKANEAQHKTTPAVHPDEVILHRDAQDGTKKNKKGRKDEKHESGSETGPNRTPADDEPPLPPPALDITV